MPRGMVPFKDMKNGVNEKLGAGVFDIRGETMSVGPYEQPAYNEKERGGLTHVNDECEAV